MASSATKAVTGSSLDRQQILSRFHHVRQHSLDQVAPLSIEDMCLQAMVDTSPPKWHIAHTTWFFETFVLEPYEAQFTPFDPTFRHLFNSYYETVGTFHPRHQRGLLSRPSLEQVLNYRNNVEQRLSELAETCPENIWQEIAPLILLGSHHEQQHQELFYTDLLYSFSQNPTYPAYRPAKGAPRDAEPIAKNPIRFITFESGLEQVGSDGKEFAFDNETPRHRVYIEPYQLADRLVTNGEYLQFLNDGGYQSPLVWLSDGWATIQQTGWDHPLYWRQIDGEWYHFTLHGLQQLPMTAPVISLSYFEADAYARWSGQRLPTEFEWEHAAQQLPVNGNLLDSSALTSQPAPPGSGLKQMFGDAWEWTASPYAAFPGFATAAGAVGEYNGKFMCNQLVLKGGSFATPTDHIRASYRNFFPADARWQFSGLRLARGA